MSSLDTDTNIVPFNETVTQIVTRFNVYVEDVQLFTRATLKVFLYDANNSIVKIDFLEISGEDYTNWNTNDEYIIQYVANKLGFTITP
jgi:hypothetical protein